MPTYKRLIALYLGFVSVGGLSRAADDPDYASGYTSVSPDGSLVIGDRKRGGGLPAILDARTGEVVTDLRQFDYVTASTFSPDGSSVALSLPGFDKPAVRGVVIWNVAERKLKHRLPLKNDSDFLAFSPDGSLLLTKDRFNNNALVWDTVKGETRAVWSPPKNSGKIMYFFLGQKPCALSAQFSGSQAKGLRTTNLLTGEAQKAFEPDLPASELSPLAVSSDGRTAAVLFIEMTPQSNPPRLLQDGWKPKWGIYLIDTENGSSIGPPMMNPSPMFLPDHTAFALQQDGSALAVATVDSDWSRVRVWDVARGKFTADWIEERGTVRKVSFSPDGKWLAIGVRDRQDNCKPLVAVRETATGRERATVVFDHYLGDTPTFSANGNTLLAKGSDGRVVDLSVLRREIARLQKHGDMVTGLSWSKDGASLASTGFDRTVRLWDTVRHRQTTVLTGHRGLALGCTFAPDGKTIVSWGMDRTSRLWEFGGAMAQGVPLTQDTAVWCAVLHPDGSTLAAGGTDGMVTVWDLKKGAVSAVLKPPPPKRAGLPNVRWVQALSFSRDGSVLATAIGGDPTFAQGTELHKWNMAKNEIVWQRDGPLVVRSMLFAPDGTLFVGGLDRWTEGVRSLNQGVVEIRDMTTGDFRVRCPLRAQSTAWGLSLTPDGGTLAVACGDLSHSTRPGSVRFWDVKTGKPLALTLNHSTAVTCIAFDSQGARLVAGEANGTITVWNVKEPPAK